LSAAVAVRPTVKDKTANGFISFFMEHYLMRAWNINPIPA